MARFPSISDEEKTDGESGQQEDDKKWYQKDININLTGVSNKQILFFTKNLSIMLQAGSTLSEALEVMQQQGEGKLEQIVKDVKDKVNKGFEFSQALEEYPDTFSNTYISVLKVGEKTGSLGKNLKYLVEQLEKTQSLKKKILGAMFYPAVVLTGGLLVTLGIIIFILPKITGLFKSFDVELPWTTQLLINISSLFQNYGLLMGLGITAFVILLVWVLKQDFVKPFTHWLILKTPVVKTISKHFNLIMFFRTLSILLKSGITIDEGLKTCSQTVQNIKYRNFLEKAYNEVNAGDSLTHVMKQREDLFPVTNIQIISVGEDSGTLSDSLEYCSDIHEEELDDLTKNLSDILEPILLILMGLLVAFLAMSIITPIYSITGKF
mgnify:CR=1 FL=1